jgi:hypothetical protein
MKAMNIMKKILLTGLAVLSLGLAVAPRANAEIETHSKVVSSGATSSPLAIMRGGGGKDGQETHG